MFFDGFGEEDFSHAVGRHFDEPGELPVGAVLRSTVEDWSGRPDTFFVVKGTYEAGGGVFTYVVDVLDGHGDLSLLEWDEDMWTVVPAEENPREILRQQQDATRNDLATDNEIDEHSTWVKGPQQLRPSPKLESLTACLPLIMEFMLDSREAFLCLSLVSKEWKQMVLLAMDWKKVYNMHYGEYEKVYPLTWNPKNQDAWRLRFLARKEYENILMDLTPRKTLNGRDKKSISVMVEAVLNGRFYIHERDDESKPFGMTHVEAKVEQVRNASPDYHRINKIRLPGYGNRFLAVLWDNLGNVWLDEGWKLTTPEEETMFELGAPNLSQEGFSFLEDQGHIYSRKFWTVAGFFAYFGYALSPAFTADAKRFEESLIVDSDGNKHLYCQVCLNRLVPVSTIVCRTTGKYMCSTCGPLHAHNPTCKICGKEKAPMRCATCKRSHYCSYECLEKDWMDGHAEEDGVDAQQYHPINLEIECLLRNELVFPNRILDVHDETEFSYKRYDVTGSPLVHWTFLCEIVKDLSFITRPNLICKDTSGRSFYVAFYLDDATAYNQDVKPYIKPGSVIALRYAARKFFLDGTVGFRMEDKNIPFVKIFKGPLSQLYAAADLYFVDNPGSRNCWCCQSALEAPARCSRCNLAVYCDRDCQRNDWQAHKSVCKYIPDVRELTGKGNNPFDVLSFDLRDGDQFVPFR